MQIHRRHTLLHRQILQQGFATKANSCNTIVIGAGLAGLAAAKRLQFESKHKEYASEKSVVVLEAKNRIGGRVWTDNYLGHAMDLGAQWLYAQQVQKSQLFKVLQDSNVYYKLWRVDPKEIAAYHRTTTQQDFTLLSEERVANVRPNLKVLHGANLVFPTGLWSLFSSIESANLDIRLGEACMEISYDRNSAFPVSVKSQKQNYHAKQVIVTAPLAVLKSGSIQLPPLPTQHLTAIRRLRTVLLDKCILMFPPESNILPKGKSILLINGPRGSMEFFSTSLFNPDTNGLIAYLSGDLAREVESWDDDEIVREAMDILRSALPEVPDPIGTRITRWASDPFARASFTRAVEADEALITALATPIPIPPETLPEEGQVWESEGNYLFFAGEHTSVQDVGTVQGAWTSGRNAAELVLEEWKKEPI
jgi:monoamine oxidase